MIALVPARGGSKGLPGKNIRPLCGKPLIAWTIEAARAARHIDRVIVSTDDEAIAAAAQACGGEVPFLRPAHLAGDDSLAIDAYLYTLDRLKQDGTADLDAFVVLLPTAPLRLAEDIDAAIDLFKRRQADSVISVTPLGHPLAWTLKVSPNGTLRNCLEAEDAENNRQAFASAYLPNGSIYVLRHSLLRSRLSYYTDQTYPYIMPPERSVDIDTLFEFEFAEYLLKKRENAIRPGGVGGRIDQEPTP